MNLFKRSNGIYYIKFWDENGKEKRFSTKKRKKSEALKVLKELKNQSNVDILPLSFRKFRETYLHFIQRSRSKAYYKNVNNAFNFISKFIKESDPICSIKSATFESNFIDLFQKSPHAAKTYLIIIKAALTKVIEWDLIKFDPFQKVKLPKIEKNLPAYITQRELDAILLNTKKKDLREIFTLLFHTGMRIGECLNLYWSDIDIENKTIKITNKTDFTTKNKKERHIPMNNTVLELLRNKIQAKKIFSLKDEYIFSKTPGIKHKVNTVYKTFKKAVRQANLDDKIHLHSLRHSFCSNLVSKGVSLYIVKELAGHESITTTQIYSHLQKETLEKAVNLLDA
ncbi:tyrosine-type recombinase/integrase [Bacteroidota bacterium]